MSTLLGVQSKRIRGWVPAAAALVLFLFLGVPSIQWRDRPLPFPGCDRAFMNGGLLHLVWGHNCSHYRIFGMCSWHDRLFCGGTHCGGKTTACESHLKNLATALEMFAADHQGDYPAQLSQLAPAYLPKIPECPAGMGSCPLNASAYDYRVDGQHFEVICKGDKHLVAGRPTDFPRYHSELGLLRDREG